MSGGRGEKKTPTVSRWIFLFLAGFVILVDQLTKAAAQIFLTPGNSRPIINNFFHLTLVENQGIAFGLFQGGDKVLLVIITLSIAALIAFGFHASTHHLLKVQVGLGLILGGAAGNWIDRIRLGAVIDFLDFRIWPVFNLADSAITIGVGIFLLELFSKKRSTSKDNAA